MAAVDNGTAHLFGIEGSIINATVQDFSVDFEFANKTTTENEQGNVIERRSDDRTSKATITLKYKSTYNVPAIGTNLTYDNVVYEIDKVTKATKNKDFRMLTLSLITSEGVTLS